MSIASRAMTEVRGRVDKLSDYSFVQKAVADLAARDWQPTACGLTPGPEKVSHSADRAIDFEF